MTSWLFTALFVLLMTGASVSMLAILVGLCREGFKGARCYIPLLAVSEVRGRPRGLNT